MVEKVVINGMQVDLASLRVIHYPDPRLRAVCQDVRIDEQAIRSLADRMFELMDQARGVGLAAPQVGLGLRLFTASPASAPSERAVYVNPRIVAVEGQQEDEEGCLSFPGINCKIKRAAVVTIRALDAAGKPFEQTGQDMLARIFQHEIDHLDGMLLVDRMGSVAKLANRRTLKELEEVFAEK